MATRAIQVELVEPDVTLARTLGYVLECQGYAVRCARGVAEARAHLAGEGPVDILISELSLPDGRGVDLCSALRAHGRTRQTLALLMAANADEIDRVVAFELGADDFVAKPFYVRELLLRLRALTRRTARNEAGRAEVVASGRVALDLGTRVVTVDGRPTALPPTETRLLAALLAAPGRVFSRTELIESVWRGRRTRETRSVDGSVKRLRRCLGTAAAPLETIRGVGFVWRPIEGPLP